MMDILGPQRSAIAIFIFVLIIFPLGIVAVVDRPNWSQAQWETELDSFRLKYYHDVKGGADGPIPELIECALNSPKKFPKCPDDLREVLLNEILLRKQYKGFNEDCNSRGALEDDVVLNPPKRVAGLDFKSYSEWQENLINSKIQIKLIDTKIQFCDPLKFLRCSPDLKCACPLGSTWSPPNDVRPDIEDRNTCAIPHGLECFIGPKDGHRYFDPFEESRAGTGLAVQAAVPPCRKAEDNCYDGEFLKEPTCLPTVSLIDELMTLDSWLAVTVLPPLAFNDACNLKDHNGFFTYSDEEKSGGYEVRIKNVEAIRVRGSKFCDLEKFLTCGTSGVCECMSPSSRKDDKCVLPEEYDKCSVDPKMEGMMTNKSIIWKAREKLMTGFASAVTVKACEGKLTCHSDMLEIYCSCPLHTTGQECDKKLTKFLDVVRVPSLPTDVEGYPEKVSVFVKFNEKAVAFEKIFKLKDHTTCVWETQIEAETIVVRIRLLAHRDTNMTKGQYEKLTDTIEAFTKKYQSQGICNETLRCQFSTKTCVPISRRNYLQDLHMSLEKSKTLKCNETGCSVFPDHHNDISFGGDEFKFYGGDHEIGYELITELHSRLSRMKAKFCADGGSCSGSAPGTCVCPKMIMMTQSVAHVCQPLSHFILLMSVTTFFVVNNY